MTEVHLINDEFRAAGTADRIFRTTLPLITPDNMRIEPGDLILGDLKTGKLDFSMPNYCVQTYLYASSKLYDVINERRLPTPPIRQDWTLLIHLPVGAARCEVLWCSMEIGRFGAEMARNIKEWRRKWKNGEYDCPVVGVPVEPLELLSSELGAEPDGVEVTLEVMAQYCQRRITTIGQHPKAKETLILWWPSGLPTPKKGITSPDQMVTLLNLLDKIEKEYSIPFMHTDPRSSPQAGLHKSQVNRNNEFLLDVS